MEKRSQKGGEKEGGRFYIDSICFFFGGGELTTVCFGLSISSKRDPSTFSEGNYLDPESMYII